MSDRSVSWEAGKEAATAQGFQIGKNPIVLVASGARHRLNGRGHRGKRLFYNAPIVRVFLSSLSPLSAALP